MTNTRDKQQMISVEEARGRILQHFRALQPEERPLLDALGQVLAEDVVARFDIPPLANTAMDGYAVRAVDTDGAAASQPIELRVAGEVAAGYIYGGSVQPGSAVRIMTGAPIPNGADAVVPFEETDEYGQEAPQATGARDGRVRIFKAATPGANVRRAGEDVRSGQIVLRRGTVLAPAQIGVLASLGLARARVIRRPRVAILSTGDEILEPGQPRAPGKIYDSNLSSIAALVLEYGGLPQPLGIARDNIDDLTRKVRDGLGADMLVTSAGVSRGDYDVVKVVLAKEGEIGFWTVNMRPGKPLAFGTFGHGERSVPHIGLPGNPVSSMIAFEVFGRPAIFTMLGKSDWERPRATAVATERMAMADGRRFYARCIVVRRQGILYASLTGSQSSGVLSGLARANALAVVPEGHADVEPGDEVEVMLLGLPVEEVPPHSQAAE